MAHHFQVNLRGMIELLSNHLYGRREVFLRELLQNAADAITARQQQEPGFRGEIQIEVTAARGKPPTLMVSDNGVGINPSMLKELLTENHSSGLRHIHERLTLLGGKMDIDSKPGKGTIVTLVAPLRGLHGFSEEVV